MIRDEIINKKYTNYSQITYMWQQKMISKEEYIILKERYKKFEQSLHII